MYSGLLGEKIYTLKQKWLNFMESVINEPKFIKLIKFISARNREKLEKEVSGVKSDVSETK